MSKLSVTEFRNLISDGAIVYCANREDCLEVIDFLQSLGFPLSETIMDFEHTETYLSPGLDDWGISAISRYANKFVERILSKTQTTSDIIPQTRAIIHFEEVPFKEVCSQQSDEDFNECFTRFLLS